jgi:hypothetical protein
MKVEIIPKNRGTKEKGSGFDGCQKYISLALYLRI